MDARPLGLFLRVSAIVVGLSLVVNARAAESTEQQRRDAQRRTVACRGLPPPYKLAGDFLLPSLKMKATDWNQEWKAGVVTTPSRLYEEFLKLEQEVAASEKAGCDDWRSRPVETQAGTTTFAAELAYQGQHELDRQKALAAIREANEKQAAQEAIDREKQKEEATAIAKKRGYRKVVFDVGLGQVVSELASGDIQLAELKGIVIELVPGDAMFTALQAVSRKQVIYTSDDIDQVLMLKNYGKVVIEGSKLDALDTSYFVVKGVTTYRTLAGTRQAIVIQSAW